MCKVVYAIWLGDAWFTSGSNVVLQKCSCTLPIKTWAEYDLALAEYYVLVNRGIIIHNCENKIVKIECEAL